jgi:hypothetical protein
MYRKNVSLTDGTGPTLGFGNSEPIVFNSYALSMGTPSPHSCILPTSPSLENSDSRSSCSLNATIKFISNRRLLDLYYKQVVLGQILP